MEAIGITLVCVAVLVVPALLLSRRQRHGFRGLHRRSMQDGGIWFLGGNDSSAEQPHHHDHGHHHDSGSGGHHGSGFDMEAITVAVLMAVVAADTAGIEPSSIHVR